MVIGARRSIVYGRWSAVWAVLGALALGVAIDSGGRPWLAQPDEWPFLLFFAGLGLVVFLSVELSRAHPRLGIWLCRLAAVVLLYFALALLTLAFIGLVFVPALCATYLACASLCREHGLPSAAELALRPFRWWLREWRTAFGRQRGASREEVTKH